MNGLKNNTKIVDTWVYIKKHEDNEKVVFCLVVFSENDNPKTIDKGSDKLS